MNIRRVAVCFIITFSTMVFVTGCATTAPKANFSHEIATESLIAATDEAKVKIEAGTDVTIGSSEKARLANTIEQKIASLKILNNGNGGKKIYEVELLLTRYDKGNAFARSMLAGLGQMHIDGEIK